MHITTRLPQEIPGLATQQLVARLFLLNDALLPSVEAPRGLVRATESARWFGIPDVKCCALEVQRCT